MSSLKKSTRLLTSHGSRARKLHTDPAKRKKVATKLRTLRKQHGGNFVRKLVKAAEKKIQWDRVRKGYDPHGTSTKIKAPYRS